MPTPIKAQDDRRATPAKIAAELGWPRLEAGWSWDSLLRLAERRFYENKARLGALAVSIAGEQHE